MSSSVSVFDWRDPTTNSAATILQPVLLASRKSCNGTGNWYPQAGDHRYRFTITSHAGGWRNGWRDGIGANHQLEPVVGVLCRGDARLPESLSFLAVSMSNVVVSAVKKCGDDNAVVVRMYDIEGVDGTAEVKLFTPAKAAEKTSIIEDNGAPLPVKNGAVELRVGHHVIETVKIFVANGQVNRLIEEVNRR